MQSIVAKEKKLMDLFPEISFDGDAVFLKTAEVLKINVHKKSRQLELVISSNELVHASCLKNLEQNINEVFGLNSTSIKIIFRLSMSLSEILNQYWDSIIFLLNNKVALSKGILSNSTFKLHDKKLVIKLKTCASEILISQGCNKFIEEFIEESFSSKVRVEFRDALIDDAERNEYLEHKEKEEFEIANNVVSMYEISQSTDKSSKNEATKKLPENNVIYGKSFNESILDMDTITQDSGKIAVLGDIVRVEYKPIRNGKTICIFDVTDYKSTLTAKFFIKNDDMDYISENIKEKNTIKLRGEAQYDKFSGELSIFATDIIAVERQKKLDTADVKRVELHLHTQMSSMDAVSPVKELIKRAAEWGHKAIAITDHGVVQAYPDAFEAGKKNNIKILYGVECYLLDGSIPVVYNQTDYQLDQEFVVFDIETTGLDSVKDRITEIGAVKVMNGQITGKFSSFVNPGIPIPENIVKLTGITDDMVSGASSITEVLPEFLEFVQDLPLVAHNASFDMGFIKYNAGLMGKSIMNPVVDTLQLSRNMFPSLGKYRLNIVAQHLGIKLENHHRAVDDSTATAGIFSKCVEMLIEKGLNTLSEVQKEYDTAENYTKAKSYHAVILVRNAVGLKNLYKIISYSHLNYYYKKPRVPKKLLMEHREGLILGSACEAGELYQAILDNKSDEDIKKIANFYDYLEIQPLGNNQFLVNSGKVKGQNELKDINRKIISLGEIYKKPVVATCDVHFMEPRDEVFRRILMAGQGYTDADNQAPLYYRTTEEMLAEFDYLGKEKAYEVVVANTNLIADIIEEIPPIPKGTFPPKLEGAEEEIRTLSEAKAKELYGDPLPEIVEKRMEKELDSIIKNGFAVMYLIAQKLVTKSLNDGYLVGSRGSVGSSFVANMAGITEVNSLQPHYRCAKCKYSEFITDSSVDCGFDLPDKLCPKCGSELSKDGYDIPFETFLGIEGAYKEPDIDLNFSGEYQPVIHRYTEELFGVGHVFRAGTIATVADKTAYGFVKNYLDERNIVVTTAEINRLVSGCTGVKRTTGQHPGGIMIVPQDKEIYDFSPVQRPADDMKSETTTTHFDYNFLHGSILKFDILGHTVPTTIKMLEDLTGIKATTIPIGEKKTMSIFNSTEALGIKPEDIDSEVGTLAIPEFGTKFVKPMLLETMPKTFAELIRISGLSHGTDVWTNNAQELIRTKVTTLLDAICCRDDIMLYLAYKGLPTKIAFKIMEDVRKGKGLKEEYEIEMRKYKVPNWYIDSCKKIKYMFPKAHAAAYVMMAFRIAWFKVYYPVHFYVTYFTVSGGDFDAGMMIKGQDLVRNKIKEFEKKGNNATQKEKDLLTMLQIVNEMYARGIEFLPIDLYKSDASKFLIENDSIRPPLSSLQGLGGAAAQNIVEARKAAEFTSIADLKIRAKASKSVIELLQQNGCLQGMHESNQLSLF